MSRFEDPRRPLIGPGDMQVVERVLGMRTGYVLDFSDRTFDQFIAHEAGVDATAPRFSVDGGSKAKRLRRILPSLSAATQARLLRALLTYRDSPARSGAVEILDDEWRHSYERIIHELEDLPGTEAQQSVAASSWTGRRTLRQQIAVVRDLVPLAGAEVEALADIVEARRFNDPVTAEAVECLRELHRQLGDLLAAVDRGSLTREAVAALARRRATLERLLRGGAKLTLVAPAMTLGVMHILSWISGVPADSTMLSSVFGSIVAHDALKGYGRSTGLAPSHT